MSYPNNDCGECAGWLAFGEINKEKLVRTYCMNCKIFKEQRFIRHIPSGCCYPLEEDNKTVIICGAYLTPNIDGKVFWEYTDKYEQKVLTPSNPHHSTKD